MGITNRSLTLYLREDSNLYEVLAAKIANLYSSLPQEIELLWNSENSSLYPEEEEMKHEDKLDLSRQIC